MPRLCVRKVFRRILNPHSANLRRRAQHRGVRAYRPRVVLKLNRLSATRSSIRFFLGSVLRCVFKYPFFSVSNFVPVPGPSQLRTHLVPWCDPLRRSYAPGPHSFVHIGDFVDVRELAAHIR